jgi:DNA-binding NarL/FixJ family response regulator
MNIHIKIAIAEPSLIIRSGIISILKRLQNFQTEVFEIEDIEQLKIQTDRIKPDILMINPALLPLPQLRKETGNPQIKHVALLISLTENNILRMFDEVISIYDSAEQIREKLEKLASVYEPEKRHESLTSREKEVMICIIRGMTNKQIADKLFLSAHTVSTHRKNISAKLQIHSSAGLTIYAIVNKLVELDDIKGFETETEE